MAFRRVLQCYRRITTYVDDARVQIFASDKKKLEEVTRHCLEAEMVGFDSEFTSFPLYQPKVELIQVSTPTMLACIDCVAIPRDHLKSFAEVLSDKKLIMHAAEQDLKILRGLGGNPRNLFDTQIAGGMCGIGSTLGLDRLCESVLDVVLEKTESLSDWRIRPLSRNQITYAIGDVQHLHRMHTLLQENLERLGRTAWFHEDMETALKVSPDPPLSDRYKTVRRIGKIKDNKEALDILQELAHWREVTAKGLNMHPTLILRDETMVAIAKSKPQSEKDLASLQGMKATTLRFHGNAILHSIRQGLERSLITHDILPLPPAILLDEQQKNAVGSLRHLLLSRISSKASEIAIAADVLATEGEVGQFSMASADHIDPSLFRFLNGWRADVIGHELQKIRKGELGIRWDNQTNTFILQ